LAAGLEGRSRRVGVAHDRGAARSLFATARLGGRHLLAQLDTLAALQNLPTGLQ
jgi:hypothetical protein